VHCVVVKSLHTIHNFLTLILIINIPHNVWIVDNIFTNNYTLDECTCHCITYSVTAHPDDAQAQLKHVGARNWGGGIIVHFVSFLSLSRTHAHTQCVPVTVRNPSVIKKICECHKTTPVTLCDCVTAAHKTVHLTGLCCWHRFWMARGNSPGFHVGMHQLCMQFKNVLYYFCENTDW
jgi:hypothetical protein